MFRVGVKPTSVIRATQTTLDLRTQAHTQAPPTS